MVENSFIRRWHGREDELHATQDEVAACYEVAAAAGDSDNFGVIVGENVGLIHDIEPAGSILERMVGEAETLLAGAPSFIAQ